MCICHMQKVLHLLQKYRYEHSCQQVKIEVKQEKRKRKKRKPFICKLRQRIVCRRCRARHVTTRTRQKKRKHNIYMANGPTGRHSASMAHDDRFHGPCGLLVREK